VNLHTTTDIVKNILQECPDARNSDNVLYLKVLKVIGEEKGISLENMSVISFFMQMKELGVPPLKTVTRSRRKIVKAYPHLAGNDTVEGFRAANEEEFREYARQVMV
jgi:hypothetical protein